jgi:uncharacterized protein YjbJ (UPF0337 family)
MSTNNKVKNTADIAKGRVKETAGSLTGNSKLKHDGKMDQHKSNMKQSGEKAKDALRK